MSPPGFFSRWPPPLAVTFPVTNGPVSPSRCSRSPKPLEVLLESVLHELGPVLNLAQVRVDPSHHLLGSMTVLAGRRMDALRTDQSARGRPKIEVSDRDAIDPRLGDLS